MPNSCFPYQDTGRAFHDAKQECSVRDTENIKSQMGNIFFYFI